MGETATERGTYAVVISHFCVVFGNSCLDTRILLTVDCSLTCDFRWVVRIESRLLLILNRKKMKRAMSSIIRLTRSCVSLLPGV